MGAESMLLGGMPIIEIAAFCVLIALGAALLVKIGGELRALRRRFEADSARSEQLHAQMGRFASSMDRVGYHFENLEKQLNERVSRLSSELAGAQSRQRAELDEKISGLRNGLTEQITNYLSAIFDRQKEELKRVADNLRQMRESADDKQERMRQALTGSLVAIKDDNGAKLDTIRTTVDGQLEKMRRAVDEKLNETLEKRLNTSFGKVYERMDSVTRTVGEMKEISTSVVDLKRLLSNVSLRGKFGETVLDTLISDVLLPHQYEAQREVVPGSRQRVDFAVKHPGAGDADVWLPIDSKFPMDAYEHLLDALDAGDRPRIERARRELETAVRTQAKSIRAKYVSPPYSTNMAVMFLPSEGLFAEVVRIPGLMQDLQTRHQVLVAGPTNLYAILEGVKFGFKNRDMQHRAADTLRLLEAVKTEFGKFGEQFQKVRKKLQEAQNAAGAIDPRVRAVGRKLRDVGHATDERTQEILANEEMTFFEDGG